LAPRQINGPGRAAPRQTAEHLPTRRQKLEIVVEVHEPCHVMLDQAAASRHVADPDQPGPVAGHPGEGGLVQLAVLVVGHHGDLGAGAAGDLPVGQHIAAVLGAAGQDLVAGAKGTE
jgi:hypothetical protein